MNSTPDPVGDDTPQADVSPAADAVDDAAPADQAAPARDAALEGDAEVASDAEPEPADAAGEAASRDEVLPDPALLEAHDLALAALREITPEATIGVPAGYRVEADGVVSLRFTNRLAGYPGWFWTVSLARVEGAEPTVLEVELLPGDGALLAPEWVPWAVRLAEYQAAQAAAAEAAQSEPTEEDVETDEDLDDVDDLDTSDFDDDGSPILHAGDVDGVDIDELAEAGDDDEADQDDDEADEDDDESDEDDDESDDFDEDDESDDFDDDDDEDDDESDLSDEDDDFEDDDESDGDDEEDRR